MATQQTRPFSWEICLGRNGYDSPLSIPEDMAVEAINWVFTGALGKKREGCTLVTIGGDPFTGYAALGSFVPGQDDAAAELFIFSADVVTKILRVPLASAINLTLADAVQNADVVSMVQHHGKFYLAYNSAVNRLHVYSPTESTTIVRRVGLAAPGAPTVVDTGTGTYPAVLRYYRIQYLVVSGGVVLRASNLGPPTAFTPSGVNLAARISHPALLGEGETHWRVHASPDDLAYYQFPPLLPIVQPAFDDATAVADYALFDFSPLEGANTAFPSVKFVGSDGRHLFGFGVWETSAGAAMAPVPGRVYFTPALDTSETGDDERVSNSLIIQGWIDCAPNGGGVDRGLSGPMNNRMYAFQSRGIYMIVPTGDAVSPFARVVLTTAYGSVSNESQVMAEDEDGQPALYFLDPNDGPRRISVGRTIQWLGKDIFDIWQTMNLQATSHAAIGLYDAPRKRVLWWVATGTSTFGPDRLIVYDVTRGRAESATQLRYGWSTWNGDIGAARCAVLFPPDLGTRRAGPPVPHLTPYIGLINGTLLRQDGQSNTDGGVLYQAAITSRPFSGGTLRRLKRIMEAYLIAKAGAATITQTITKNFGLASASSAQSLAPSGTERRVRKQFDQTDVADLMAVQITLGDSAPLNQTFELDQWVGADEVEQGARQ